VSWRFDHRLGDGAADPFVAEEGSNEPCRGLHETAGMVRAAEQQPDLPPLFVGHTIPGPFVQVHGGREKSGREVRLLDVAPGPRSPGAALGLPFQKRIGLVGQRHLIDLVGQLSTFNVHHWHKALIGAGIEPGREVGMHALRHFFASALLDAGESIKAIAEWLGHSDPAFTLRTYTHLMQSSQGRARRAIDTLFDGWNGQDGPETAQERV
jgi:Phage integrase family